MRRSLCLSGWPASSSQIAASASSKAERAASVCRGSGALKPGVSRISTRVSDAMGIRISTRFTLPVSIVFERGAQLARRHDALLRRRLVVELDARERIGRVAKVVERRRRREHAGRRDVGAHERVDERALAGVELADDRDAHGARALDGELGDLRRRLERVERARMPSRRARIDVQSPGAPDGGDPAARARSSRAASAQARARVVSIGASSSRIAAASPGSLSRAGEGRRRASRSTASSACLV